MPTTTTYYKSPASPSSSSSNKQQQQQQQQDQASRPATWHHPPHHRHNNHPSSYGFIPVHVPSWFALSGLGYHQQQQQQYLSPGSIINPANGGGGGGAPVPTGIFFTGEQPSSSSNMGGATAWEPVGSPEPAPHEATTGGPGAGGGDNNDNRGDDDDEDDEDDDNHHNKRHNGGGASVTLVPGSRAAAPPEPQTDQTLRSLARHLQEAIAVCEGYAQEHENNTEGVRPYLDAASRDRLWAGLLARKFREDEGHRHLLRNLPYDVDAAVRQALRAAHRERKQLRLLLAATTTIAAAAGAGDHQEEEQKQEQDQQEKLDRCDKRAHEIEILRMRGARVAKLAGAALVTPGECKKLVEEMTLMRETIETMCAKTEY